IALSEWRIAKCEWRAANSEQHGGVCYAPRTFHCLRLFVGRTTTMPHTARSSFAALALTALCAAPAGAALILHKDLSLDIAKTIAESAVAACAAKGFAVSAVLAQPHAAPPL